MGHCTKNKKEVAKMTRQSHPSHEMEKMLNELRLLEIRMIKWIVGSVLLLLTFQATLVAVLVGLFR
jgi:hypothetical protein